MNCFVWRWEGSESNKASYDIAPIQRETSSYYKTPDHSLILVVTSSSPSLITPSPLLGRLLLHHLLTLFQDDCYFTSPSPSFRTTATSSSLHLHPLLGLLLLHLTIYYFQDDCYFIIPSPSPSFRTTATSSRCRRRNRKRKTR